MSDFLNQLSKVAKTKEELKQQELESQKQAENFHRIEKMKQISYIENSFDASFIQSIKDACLDAASNNCYICFNNKRYLLCSISVECTGKHSYDDYNYDDYIKVYLRFSCTKLLKNHIISSKRKFLEYACYKTIVDTDYLDHLYYWNIMCSREVNLSKKIQNLDGYVDIKTLPKEITEKHIKPFFNTKFDQIEYVFYFLIEF